MRFFSIILFWIFLGGSDLFGQGSPSIKTRLESSMIVVGEKTYLTVWAENIEPIIDWPTTPKAAPLVLKRESQRRFQINGRIRSGFRYLVSAFEPGIYSVPSFEVRSRSGVIRSKTHTVRVVPVEKLETHGIKINGDVTPYLTGVFLQKTNPYLGETQDVEAKLYLSQAAPHLLRLSDGNVLNIKKDGLAAWRFTTTSDPTGYLDYDGHQFAVYTYPSSVNALRDGELFLGPGSTNATLLRRQMVRGGFATGSFVTEIVFPAVKLNVRSLPDGAPADFGGAVGSFSLEVRPLSLELELGGSLTVETRITGSGNIDQFPGPQLFDPDENWKKFETMAKPSGGERRSSSGTAEFSHVLRPLKKVPALPPYRFVYFDPLLESYETKESPPFPITITGELPSLEGAGETLAFLTPGNRPLKSFANSASFAKWSWQMVPALIICWILGVAFRNKVKARQVASLPQREFENELKQVTSVGDDRVRFFREAARFAADHNATEGFEEIFETRDEICFRQDSTAEPIEPGEKKRVLRLLRNLCPLLLFFILAGCLVQPASGSDLAPDEAKKEILAAMEVGAVREHLHNLSICEKELGNFGEAALLAFRYKLQGGDSSSLMEGLPGNRAHDPEGTEWVSILPKWVYFQAGVLGLWSLAIVILTAWNILGGSRKPLLLTFSILMGVGFLIGGTGLWLYPEGVSFKPLSELSVVVRQTPMRSQPFEGAPAARENVIGSLCLVQTTRAGWAKIELPGGYTGWIREEDVSPIVN
ncbi:MAG: hypothetical protein ABF379_14435 [Akkermansiaceae bacterium]